jgi:hypothetical protein
MALDTTKIKMMELTDVTVYEMTADAGAAPTYATGIPIPGIVRVGLKPEMASAELEGDGGLLDVFSKMKAAEVTIESGYLNMALAAIISGVTATTTGTTPSQVTSYEVTRDSRPKWFKVEGRWMYPGLGLGSVNFTLWKCKATDPGEIAVEDANGKFGTTKITAKAVPCESTGKIYKVTANETAAALST